MRVFSFSTELGSDAVLQFRVTCSSKTFRSSKGAHRKNLNKLKRSVKRFWIGVPVTPQRHRADRSQTDIAKDLDGFRIMCADRSAVTAKTSLGIDSTFIQNDPFPINSVQG